VFTVEGRPLKIANLDRVLYPKAGTRKAELLAYYVRIAPVMVPHLRERLLHMHRYPEGVDGPRFWQKECPAHKPEWVPTAGVWSPAKQQEICYCVLNELAAVLWAVNLGSLELHTSLHTREDHQRPTDIVFDLDPGPGVDILACAEVALRLREVLGGIGLPARVKTSGNKGLQVYAAVELGYAQTKPLARRVAEGLEERWPERVVSRMAKALRPGKVLIDWQQNTEHKSMVAPYSARARERPTVSTPLRWEELETGDPGDLRFELGDVLRRVEAHGDLFAEAA
jgi:bifunctional non-homologous end joining protein LigD